MGTYWLARLEGGQEGQEALNETAKDLSALLKLNKDGFWTAVMWPSSGTPKIDSTEPTAFLDDFLSIQARVVTSARSVFSDHDVLFEPSQAMDGVAESKIVQRVFQLFHRIAMECTECAFAREGAVTKASVGGRVDSEVLCSPMTLPRLMDFCTVYVHTNHERTVSITAALREAFPWMVDEVTAAVDIFIWAVRAIQKRLEKMKLGAGGGKGKGKGKGKGGGSGIAGKKMSEVAENSGGSGVVNVESDLLPRTWNAQELAEIEVAPASALLNGVDELCTLLIQLLDTSQFDGPVEFLAKAPLLVDMEVEFGVGDVLRLLRNRMEDDDGDISRLDFLIRSLDQMLTFSGNNDVRRRRAAFKARRLEASQRSSGKTGKVGNAEPQACLIAMDDDAETVIMKILENDLPDVVSKLDRTQGRAYVERSMDVVPYVIDVSNVKALKPPLRHNVFDNDEFDIFAKGKVDMNKVILGKKDKTSDVMDSGSDKNIKQAIINAAYRSMAAEDEALVEFTGNDDYDDERDDSYDAQDVKLAGTFELRMLDEEVVDERKRVPIAAVEDDPAAEFEDELESYVGSGSLAIFDKKSRKTPERVRLRLKTGLTDEQIEGWYTMFQRDKKLEEKLEWKGNQSELPPVTSWKAHDEELSDSEGETRPNNYRSPRVVPSDRRGRGKGRGFKRDARAKKMNKGMGGGFM
ncbi:hypothetical protein HK101_011231 [Irineochytrium annulatum]|nr:hypothetical protein HK101_011231 [Irineochytrium annulatum]